MDSFLTCSANRIRTYDQLVTHDPDVSIWGGLYHLHSSFLKSKEWGASINTYYWCTPVWDSLWTFPDLHRDLAADHHCAAVHKKAPSNSPHFSLQRFHWRLRIISVQFSVAICTNKYTFVNFFTNLFPTTSKSVLRNSEWFCLFISMMKVKCLHTSIIATQHTFTASILNRFCTQHLSTFWHSALEICRTVSVGPFIHICT